MSSTRAAVGEDKSSDEEEEEEEFLPARLPPLASIFHCEKVQTTAEGWKCLWCTNSYKKQNATKCVYHLAKISGKGAKACTYRNIPKPYARRYMKIYEKMERDRLARNRLKQAEKNLLQNHLNSVDSNRKAPPSSVASMPAVDITVDGTHNIDSSVTMESPCLTASTAKKKQKIFHQATLGRVRNPSKKPREDQALHRAIANWIHSTGQDFSVCSSALFRDVIAKARDSSVLYKCPSRNQIANELLTDNYNAYVARIQGE